MKFWVVCWTGLHKDLCPAWIEDNHEYVNADSRVSNIDFMEVFLSKAEAEKRMQEIIELDKTDDYVIVEGEA